MTINQATADVAVSVLDTAPWALPCLSAEKDALDQVRSVADFRPERIGRLIEAMTNIEHRLNHPATIEAGMRMLLTWGKTYCQPETLVALLDASEYLDFSVEKWTTHECLPAHCGRVRRS